VAANEDQMRAPEAKALGIPLSALNPPLPVGWKKLTRGNVQEGDMIHLPEGWVEASKVAEVGTNSKFYACVIRRTTNETK